MSSSRIPLPILGDEKSFSLSDAQDAHPAHAEPAPAQEAYGKSYWQSIEAKLNPKRLIADKAEFPKNATEPPQGFVRRDFMKLMGASMALAGLTACSERPVEPILPYTANPENMVPGNALHYATAWSLRGHATGLLVTAREGRPIKVEGNPEHPTGKGATGLYEQALTIQLYDPQRARVARHNGAGASWRSLREWLVLQGPAWEKDGGAGLRFWLEPSASPFRDNLRQQITKRFPQAKFYSHTPLSEDNVLEGAKLAFGNALHPRYELAGANVIVSLDADFLEPIPENLHATRSYASRRSDLENLNRLYAIESRLSITGATADQRLKMKPSQIEGFARALLAELGASDGTLSQFRSTEPGRALTAQEQKWVKALARDLSKNRGQSAVLVGEGQPAVVHAIGFALNSALGNIGKTVQFFPAVTDSPATSPASWKELADDLDAGKVDTLVITTWNPVYSAPVDLEIAKRIAKAKNSIYLGLFEDETAPHATWFVPQAHPLESWGDLRALDGTTTLVQPLIAPMFGGLTETELLAAFLDEPEMSDYDRLRQFWNQQVGGANFGEQWEVWLSKGVIPGRANQPQTPGLAAGGLAQALQQAPKQTQGMEIAFVRDYSVFDGRFGNAPWLQEVPDPITKVTWDNPALVSQTTLEKLGIGTPKDRRSTGLIEITYKGRKVTAPVMGVPGLPDEVIHLPLGYGRTAAAEEVAHGIGYNAYGLRTSDALWFDGGAKASAVEGDVILATTQEHWVLEAKDGLEMPQVAISQTLEEFKKDPMVEETRGVMPTVLEPVTYEGYKWGMAIDMNRCTGCSACVVACQAENNIPTVGKDQVYLRREMHWLRIDRYFEGDVSAPKVINQPMACQHCEAAPCEYVCPVNATTTSDEGLNEMVYNRCIGTRYCSNNCPYKVRRFNYLHWNADKDPLVQMAMNPDVTVRARGVMEKCTYCVQRIERARIQSRIDGKGEMAKVVTACQQACPTQAITFGTLSDPNALVTKQHHDERRYDVLHFLNTRPRTAYLARVTNPNPELA